MTLAPACALTAVCVCGHGFLGQHTRVVGTIVPAMCRDGAKPYASTTGCWLCGCTTYVADDEWPRPTPRQDARPPLPVQPGEPFYAWYERAQERQEQAKSSLAVVRRMLGI